MQNNKKISFTSEFKKNLKSLAKKYKRIKSDLNPYIDDLKLGKILGEQLQGISLKVYKVRIPNSSAGKGKRAGFRLIYYLQLPNEIILISIYSKNMQQNISNNEIIDIIKHYSQ